MNNKPTCHPDTPESGQQTIHIKELRRSWWDIGNVGSAHPTRIKRWGEGWMLLLHMYVESDTYILHFPILDYGKKNFCRFSKDEINKLESFMQKCAKEAYEKRHEPPSYEITRK